MLQCFKPIMFCWVFGFFLFGTHPLFLPFTHSPKSVRYFRLTYLSRRSTVHLFWALRGIEGQPPSYLQNQSEEFYAPLNLMAQYGFNGTITLRSKVCTSSNPTADRVRHLHRSSHFLSFSFLCYMDGNPTQFVATVSFLLSVSLSPTHTYDL